MAGLKRLVWNPDERRIPALWRLLLHALAIVLIGVVVNGVVTALIPAGLLEPGAAWAWPLGAAMTAGVVAAATGLAGRVLDGRSFAGFGLTLDRRWWLDFAAGVGIGTALMAGIFAVELGAGWLRVTGTFVGAPAGQPFALALLAPLVLFIAVGFYEELLFRGYHLRNLAEGLNFAGPGGPGLLGPRGGLIAATLLSSAVFGLVHADNPNATVTSTVAVALAGIMLAAGLLWTGQLALPIGLHLSWNFCQGNVFGFAVSGNDAGPRVLAVVVDGDPTITGGAFGPEAGLVGIVAMIVGAGLTAAWVRATRGRLALATALADYRPDPS